ncbi:hypothetical protein Clacol_003461 [Clathrus columnatus]|uniref:Uncharacterized protein n=1 Tax=Clathrus columnatus TaxID=1419009 RepID=A0AAV5A3K0_9AGAM|nr:hypothetical protein Clacol_003461 [Clathrus columnatus]
MLVPDALPLEIWYRIIKVGEISDQDSKAMLAIAPQTTARNMHDAAFSTIFQSVDIGFGEGTDENKLASKLSSYLDSLPLRSTTRYLRVDISTESWMDAEVHLPPKLDDLICNVLSALPNIIGLDWRDCDHIGSRKERRWGCIRSCLPQLTKLIFRQYQFETPLDLRVANALQFLSLQHCQFYHAGDGPWIISDAKIQTLSLHIEDVNLKYSPMGPRSAPTRPTNILSRLNISSVTSFYLRLPSPSQQDISYLLTGSLSNNSFGLGANLQSLLLCKIDLPLALALGNTCSFPSLHSCYLECLLSPPLPGTQYLVRPLCLFLNRQVSLERLECVFSKFDMPPHEAAQYVDDVVNMLHRLKDLKCLKLTGYTFSLDHPAFRMAPLAQLQVLSIRSTNTSPLPEIVGTVAEKLQSYPSLQEFHWQVLMQPTDSECLDFEKTLKNALPPIKFVQVKSTSFWTRSVQNISWRPRLEL